MFSVSVPKNSLQEEGSGRSHKEGLSKRASSFWHIGVNDPDAAYKHNSGTNNLGGESWEVSKL